MTSQPLDPDGRTDLAARLELHHSLRLHDAANDDWYALHEDDGPCGFACTEDQP